MHKSTTINPTMLNITIADNTNIDGVFAIRNEVFCGEQQVDPQIERDRHDKVATHLLAMLDGNPVGCCRVLWENDSAHVGRLAVLKEYRKQGVGKAICEFLFDYCKRQGYTTIWLNAQLHSVDFYKKLGFQTVDDVFMEADMEHVKMVKRLL